MTPNRVWSPWRRRGACGFSCRAFPSNTKMNSYSDISLRCHIVASCTNGIAWGSFCWNFNICWRFRSVHLLGFIRGGAGILICTLPITRSSNHVVSLAIATSWMGTLISISSYLVGRTRRSTVAISGAIIAFI